MTPSLQSIGYGLACLVFLIFALLLATRFRGRAQGGILLIAAIVSAAWAFGLAYDSAISNLPASRIFVLEFMFDGVWLLFLAALLTGAVGTAQVWLVRFGGVLLAIGLLLVGLYLELFGGSRALDRAGSIIVFGSLLTTLFGLVGIEQIYRNARVSQLKGLKYLCLGLGGIFSYDLFLYSNAILEGEIGAVAWGVRGYVIAMCVPILAVAVSRAPSWSAGVFVSRKIVFYSATLFGAGIYLTLVGFVGYYIRVAGGNWGPAAQLIFTSAAFLLLGIFLFSERLRAKLRVFISKHFFENKYDYREEWLRLTDTLTSLEDELPLRKRVLKALAQIVDAPSGLLWMMSSDQLNYRCVSNWNTPELDIPIPADSSLPLFLEDSGWVIERSEYDRDPDRYQNLDLTEVAIVLGDYEFVIPLLHEGALIGFATLSESTRPETLNFEDRDLLKTSGKQIASYLSQELSTEQLAESRQFEAFNKLTAYIMHDLKNLIAQQSLMVENAERHKNNPEFIDDAISTIKGGVVRMRKVIEHLQQTPADQPMQRVEVGKLVMQAVSQCADRPPVPRALIGNEQIWVRADRERLLMAIYHAIRNAQDATPADGSVSVDVALTDNECEILIVDSGKGMDEAFIRDRLFRPFDSTKGTAGMGIGAYQIRETLHLLGGRVRVESRLGEGTSVSMRLATYSSESGDTDDTE
jgi:putative PEP-CTERM system histidine kinase